MSYRKNQPLIISLIYATGFLILAVVNDLNSVDIAIYTALGYAIIQLLPKRRNRCFPILANSKK